MIIGASFDVSNPELWLNRAIQYGDGVFETMRMNHQNIPLWDFHCERLVSSLKRLKIETPDLTLIKNGLAQNCPSHLKHSSIVKLMAFRANAERGYQPQSIQVEWVLSIHPLNLQSNNHAVTLNIAEQKLAKQPLLAGLKHLNRLENVMIASELQSQDGIDDLLVLDYSDNVIETTHQNIVLIKDSQLLTPNLNSCGVNGVALNWLMKNFKVTRIDVKYSDLDEFDGIMVCNSIKGFSKVSMIKNIRIYTTDHPVQDEICQRWETIFPI